MSSKRQEENRRRMIASTEEFLSGELNGKSSRPWSEAIRLTLADVDDICQETERQQRKRPCPVRSSKFGFPRL